MTVILYIADIDQDIDDLIAIDYLLNEGVVLNVLLDPYPVSDLGLSRLEELQYMGVTFVSELTDEKTVFVGGSLSKLNETLNRTNSNLDLLVMNGGFVGSNILNECDVLEKFKNKEYVRTYNFNLDVDSTFELLNNNNNINKIYLVGKNVCHSQLNTVSGIWKYNEIVNKYNLKNKKLLHDVLMVSEGLKIMNNEETLLEYKSIKAINTGLNGKYTEWGSEVSDNSKISAAVCYKK